MGAIDPAVLDRLPLSEIRQVTFFKRDEITTDLICCDIKTPEGIWFFHEDMTGWDLLIRHLEGLPGFGEDWFAAVSRPPFATCETIAFIRADKPSLSV